MSMSPMLRAAGIVSLFVLAGCATNSSSNYSQEPMLGQPVPSQGDYASAADTPPDTTTPPPSQVASSGVDNLDIASFTDAGGFAAMADTDKSQASSAQYYALQFGRVGAARTWAGSGNVTGQISVGPYVKVNNNDCRDFTNIVNAGSKSYTKRGTACRSVDGTWTVGSATASAPAAAPAGPAAPASPAPVGATPSAG
jgi:surface antigen